MTGRDECPECGRRFESLGRHWSAGNCVPSPTDDMVAVAEGIALSGASPRGTGFQIDRQSRALVEWIARELGWLTLRVAKIDGGGAPSFRLRTHSHEVFERMLDCASGTRARWRTSGTSPRRKLKNSSTRGSGEFAVGEHQ